MVSGSFPADAIVRDPIVIRPSGTITAKKTALHILADVPDGIDEATDTPIRYYMSAERTGSDSARSPVFSSDSYHQGKLEWQGWIPPDAGSWTVHIRQASDDASVDSQAFTAS